MHPTGEPQVEAVQEIDGKPVKMIYSVELGLEVAYTLEVDGNNEILARSTENDEFLKLPNIAEEEIDQLIEIHNTEASTQIKKQPLFGQPKTEENPE